MEIEVEGLSERKQAYDKRWLDLCKCGCGFKFISKMMFKKFLEKYKDVEAEVEIWTHDHFEVARPYKEITIKVKQYYPNEKEKHSQKQEKKDG